MPPRGYGWHHVKARAVLLSSGPMCHWCAKRRATIADHDPPLGTVEDPAEWRGILRPSCEQCSGRQAHQLMGLRARMRRGEAPPSRPW